MAVIAIHRDFAAGGRELGELLSEKLGYQYVDKSLLQRVAEDLNVSETTLESFEKSREYRISNLFSKLFSKHYIERIVGYDRSVVEENEYQNSLKNLILEVARANNVVIIGRGAHIFLKDMENCYRFRLIATMEWRIQYASEKLRIAPEQAQKIIEKRDKNRAMFYQSVCGEDFRDPLLFHLTLNMSLVPMQKAAELILSVVQK